MATDFSLERRPHGLSGLAPATVAAVAGRPPADPDAPLNTPITMSSTYVAGGEHEYGRYGNPTWESFEAVLGELEGARALAFSSGMAAVSAVLDLVALGERVVVPRHAYLGVLHQLADREARGLLSVSTVDVSDTAEVLAAAKDSALVWIESPTNPALEVCDIAAVTAGAHAEGARVVVDNTFATPVLQRPLDLGADVVVHSATKFLGGHSDLMLGAVVTGDEATYAALDQTRRSRGSVPGTLETWLATRGMRTLHLRVERSQDNARELARRLAEHPAVDEMRWPDLGGIIAIVVAGGAEPADRMCRAVRLWVHATSLGGVESTLERRRRWSGEPTSIPPGLVRLSVGIEDVEDLWADLNQALLAALA